MSRKISFGEEKESIIDKLLTYLRYKKVLKYIKNQNKLLDVGCGFNGKLEKFLLKHKQINYFGVDLSTNKKKENLVESDINKKIPFENSEFDTAISLAVLEHLSDPIKNIKEIYRVLKNSGILILTTPTPLSKPILEFMAFKLKIIDRREIEDHKHYFSKKELINLLKNTGFKSIKHKYFQLGVNQIIIAIK